MGTLMTLTAAWQRFQSFYRGRQAEALAVKFLVRQGFTVVQRNYRCLFGEIDVIVKNKALLAFVEVRFRARTDYGTAAESVTYHKRRKLMATAAHFLAHSGETLPCRFDVITLDRLTVDAIQWIPNAFDGQ